MTDKILLLNLVIRGFDHAVEVCEAAFGYEGVAWEQVKNSGDISTLLQWLVEDGADADILERKDQEHSVND
ncbi:hypothetical protein [Bacillus sp. AM1(2019)]|uniref:hypothetical protein n=1 Tax=Bacillus sp. AM1(2019) TaxID=2665175 RepID=UPI0013622920|nr:hypothetical protein [Bacillus sp. AM1(2019)]QHJ03715.1 hypothetical protein GNE05_10850 [Bacillus sp. AM1(2019)]